MELDRLKAMLRIDEGIRRFLYIDTTGRPTIGCGRNIQDVGLYPDEIEYLLDNDIHRVMVALDALIPWWKGLDAVRRDVLIDMAFNMGPAKLLQFKQMLAAVKTRDYDQAASQMLQSRWASQVGTRAVRLSKLMRLGVYPTAGEPKK